MATNYQFGLSGVNSSIQYGRRGGYVVWDTGSSVFRILENDDTTLANIRVASVPISPNDAASKSYVDSAVQGLSPKEAVRAATTGPGTLSNNFEDGDTLDGIVLVQNDRILIKDQVDATENGVYIVNASGAPTRSPDTDTATELGTSFVFIQEGSTNAGQGWVTTFAVTDTIGVDDVDWFPFFSGVYTGTDGIQLIGTNFQLDLNGLSGSVAIATGDSLAVYDASTGNHIKRTFANVIDDLSIMAAGNVIGSTGIDVTGRTFSFNNSGMVNTPVTISDNVPFFDISNSDDPEIRTFGEIISDLDIRSGTVAVTKGGTGLTSIPQYSILVANSANTVATLSATNGIGDQVLQWNDGTNTYEFITSSSIGDKFQTINISGGNYTGDTAVVADSFTDTLNLAGGSAISLAGVSSSDTITISVTRTGLSDTSIVGADSFMFFDNSSSLQPVYRTFTNLLNDLDIVNDLGNNGLAVRTAVDVYTARSIVASSSSGLEGITITNGDGVSGNPVIGFNITGLATDASLTGSEELVFYNGTNNRKITVADFTTQTNIISSNIMTAEANFALGDPTTVMSLPDDGRIIRIRVAIDTSYDNDADIRVMVAGGSVLMATTRIDASIPSSIFDASVDYRNQSGSAQNIYIDIVGSPTVGSGRIYIEYYIGSAT